MICFPSFWGKEVMSVLISAENLSKVYMLRKRSGGVLKSFFAPETVQVEALRDVSFSIDRGELIGYIGPNGAGKSTTVKILSGILKPDGGNCTVLGMTPWKERIGVVSRIGVVFGQRSQLWWDLPVMDSFSLLRDIYKVPQADFQKNLTDLTDRLSLSELLQIPVRQLSLGQRMRCEIAASLLHNPSILFLDEPTIGLDAISKLAVRDFIKQKNREDGMTVILTTHDMDDIESLCTRVLLIGAGRLLMDGSVQALLSEQHERRISASLAIPLDIASLPPMVDAQNQQGNDWLFRFDPERVPVASLVSLLNERYGIVDLMVENPPIDEVIARRYAQLGQGEGL